MRETRKNLLWLLLIVFFSSCSLINKKENEPEYRQIALADDLEPSLLIDTATIAFEAGAYEALREATEEVDMDSLYATFESIPDGSLPVFTKDQTRAQVNALSGAIKLSYNSEIQESINRLVSRSGRKYMSKMLALSQLYFPVFEQVLAENGVPEVMKYAAVVESALIPNIMSRAGAVGLWQFMPQTGRSLNLEINGTVDERCGIYASTAASAKYMKKLHDSYGDWLMVLAAYNCGPGNVNRAIRRSGGKRTFWEIYDHLPRETRDHIPRFIAVYYAFHYHTDLMIAPMRDMVKYTDIRPVLVHKPIHLEQVASVFGLEEKDLAELNRKYLKGYIPAKNKEYSLLLPAYEASLFPAFQDRIYAHNRKQFFDKKNKFIAKKKDIYPNYGFAGSSGRRIVYRVRSGDVLGRIARRHGVTVRNIKKWNGLRSDRIKIGQRLYLYASTKYAKKRTVKTSGRKKVVTPIKLNYEPEKYVYHTVRKNENCWSIAQKYEGVTYDTIMQMNRIQDPGGLKIGQKLRIKLKS